MFFKLISIETDGCAMKELDINLDQNRFVGKSDKYLAHIPMTPFECLLITKMRFHRGLSVELLGLIWHRHRNQIGGYIDRCAPLWGKAGEYLSILPVNAYFLRAETPTRYMEADIGDVGAQVDGKDFPCDTPRNRFKRLYYSDKISHSAFRVISYTSKIGLSFEHTNLFGARSTEGQLVMLWGSFFRSAVAIFNMFISFFQKYGTQPVYLQEVTPGTFVETDEDEEDENDLGIDEAVEIEQNLADEREAYAMELDDCDDEDNASYDDVSLSSADDQEGVGDEDVVSADDDIMYDNEQDADAIMMANVENELAPLPASRGVGHAIERMMLKDRLVAVRRYKSVLDTARTMAAVQDHVAQLGQEDDAALEERAAVLDTARSDNSGVSPFLLDLCTEMEKIMDEAEAMGHISGKKTARTIDLSDMKEWNKGLLENGPDSSVIEIAHQTLVLLRLDELYRCGILKRCILSYYLHKMRRYFLDLHTILVTRSFDSVSPDFKFISSRLAKIPAEFLILADRGFVDDSLKYPNCNSHITPAFKMGREQFSIVELFIDKLVCTLRYTCEVCFSRVTDEAALSGIIPRSMFAIVDYINHWGHANINIGLPLVTPPDWEQYIREPLIPVPEWIRGLL
jgi:hypothetical protein